MGSLALNKYFAYISFITKFNPIQTKKYHNASMLMYYIL